MSTPNRTASFAAITQELLSRLRLRLTALYAAQDPQVIIDGTFVRLVVAPGPDDAPYKAERGLHVVVYPPQPSDGGGRYDKKVSREVVVHVVSESLLDQVGSDEAACLAHLGLEEVTIDALVNSHPDFTPAEVGTAVNVRWKGGAQPEQRLVRVDTGLVASSLAFDVQYAFPFSVRT